MPSRQIPPLTYPGFGELSVSTRALISAADGAAVTLRDYSDTILKDVLHRLQRSDGFVPLEPPFQALTHALSPFANRCGNALLEVSGRTEHERNQLRALGSDFREQLFESYQTFRSSLEIVATGVMGDPLRVRETFAVGTAYDISGNRWLYLPPDIVEAELRRLWMFLQTDDSGSSVFRSAIFIVAFLTIHPFRDGNGRVSRIIANILLFRDIALAERKYIPLKELTAIGQRGFDIACSQARFFGRTSIVCRWIANCILAMSSLQNSHSVAPKELRGIGTIASCGPALAAT